MQQMCGCHAATGWQQEYTSWRAKTDGRKVNAAARGMVFLLCAAEAEAATDITVSSCSCHETAAS
jgi:hypothetical protein